MLRRKGCVISIKIMTTIYRMNVYSDTAVFNKTVQITTTDLQQMVVHVKIETHTDECDNLILQRKLNKYQVVMETQNDDKISPKLLQSIATTVLDGDHKLHIIDDSENLIHNIQHANQSDPIFANSGENLLYYYRDKATEIILKSTERSSNSTNTDPDKCLVSSHVDVIRYCNIRNRHDATTVNFIDIPNTDHIIAYNVLQHKNEIEYTVYIMALDNYDYYPVTAHCGFWTSETMTVWVVSDHILKPTTDNKITTGKNVQYMTVDLEKIHSSQVMNFLRFLSYLKFSELQFDNNSLFSCDGDTSTVIFIGQFPVGKLRCRRLYNNYKNAVTYFNYKK